MQDGIDLEITCCGDDGISEPRTASLGSCNWEWAGLCGFLIDRTPAKRFALVLVRNCRTWRA